MSNDAFFVSRAIDQLSKLGLLKRETDPQDRRKLLLQLTPKGARIHRKVEASVNAIHADVLGSLTGEERRAVERGLALLMEGTKVLQEGGKNWEDFL